MKNHAKLVAQMPETLPQVVDLVWGTPSERMRAVDALVADADRRVLPILFECIGDDSLEVVAHVLARIDLLDPISGVLVAREMAINGHPGHLRIARSYFERHAPWELPDCGAELGTHAQELAYTGDVPRLLRGLLAPWPGLRRVAARRLLRVADHKTIQELDVHLAKGTEPAFEGVLDVLARRSILCVLPYVDMAVYGCRPGDEHLLLALARVGGVGTELLLEFYTAKGFDLAEAALFQYRPRELLVRCRKWLAGTDPKRRENAICMLLELALHRQVEGDKVQRAAIDTLVSALESPHPEVVAFALQALAKTQDASSISCDVVCFLRHPESGVRYGALRLLAAQERTDAVDAIESLQRDPECGVRAEALLVLGQLDPERQVDRVREALWDVEPSVVRAAVESLDGRTLPDDLSDLGCLLLGGSTEERTEILFEWLLHRFPERSAQIAWNALLSGTREVHDRAMAIVFGVNTLGDGS